MSCCSLVSTTPKRNYTPTKIRIITPSKDTALLWSYAESGEAEAFIQAYIHKGGNLKLTNEYGETVVKVLMKNYSKKTNSIPTKPAQFYTTNNRTHQSCSLFLKNLLIASTLQ
jgi:hypothetical protein